MVSVNIIHHFSDFVNTVLRFPGIFVIITHFSSGIFEHIVSQIYSNFHENIIFHENRCISFPAQAREDSRMISSVSSKIVLASTLGFRIRSIRSSPARYPICIRG